MNSKTIDAKCPYCKMEFKTSLMNNWAQVLWGQYSPSSTKHICPFCQKESLVSLTQIYRYSAKKIK